MPMRAIPIVPGANALGHGHLFSRDRLGLLEAAGVAGPVSRVRMLQRWILVANTPQAAHEVLMEHGKSFEKAPGIAIILKDIAGTGLFTSEGALWRKQRRLMSPLFHPSQLKQYVVLMNAVARRALGRLREGQSIDIAQEMMRITMAVVAECLFGADTHEGADELAHALTRAFEWVDEHVASNELNLQLTILELFEELQTRLPERLTEIPRRIEQALRGPVLLSGRRDPELLAALRLLNERMHALIDDRRANPQARVDLLTKLLLARDGELGGEGMTDQQVRDEASTLFVAGHETTANALSWAFYLLARNPAARARVQAEADSFGPDGPSVFVPEQLEYTTRVFKEALRLYPPIAMLMRRSVEPVELFGHAYPTRTMVLVNPYAIHRDPEVWPDPLRFDPDRFTPEREAARHRSAWIPFGMGARVCIGNAFALMEGPIVMATLMRGARFEIDPARGIVPDTFLTLRPHGGVPATVRLSAS